MKTIYLQGQKEDPDVEHITFPTGERHIRITNLKTTDDVILVYNDPSGDIMKLALAVDICDRSGVNSITLVMPFVPYARQDRIATPGDPFSIKVFAQFINLLPVDKVIITDPHSDVTPALFTTVEIVHQHLYASKAWRMLSEYEALEITLVGPDLGAAKKLKALQSYILQEYGMEVPTIQCDKTRDVATGKITGFKVLDGDPKGKHCLMIDDICDGGGTFMGLYDVLYAAGASGQSLYTTHGIYSKGTSTLTSKFNFLFTSDSFGGTERPGVRIISL